MKKSPILGWAINLEPGISWFKIDDIPSSNNLGSATLRDAMEIIFWTDEGWYECKSRIEFLSSSYSKIQQWYPGQLFTGRVWGSNRNGFNPKEWTFSLRKSGCNYQCETLQSSKDQLVGRIQKGSNQFGYESLILFSSSLPPWQKREIRCS